MIEWTRRVSLLRIAVELSAFAVAAALTAQTAPVPSAQNPGIQTPGVQAQEWKSYSYPADGFSVSFPSQPQFEKKQFSNGKGSFELRSYVAQISPVALFVGVCDYGSAASGKTADEMLQGAKNGAIANSNSRLLNEKTIPFGTHQGIAFDGESEAAHFSFRIYLVDTTLYQTLVVYPVDKPFDDAARFLDSFQLIARAAK